ncbi:MAG TPA: tetratricopeptide repeat protein [Actinocrinis sp.]|nr:tetratricopeptide repeat protein [Actinocrinis sp.]
MSERDAPHGGGRPIRNELSGEVAGNAIQAGYVNQLTIAGSGHPAPAGVLRQLPPAPRFFVGRERDVQAMSQAVISPNPDAQAPTTIVISAVPGMGKAALSTHWAHGALDRHFPDGQLYVDFSSAAKGGFTDITDVLRGFLRSLGVHQDWMPSAVDQLSALFREKTVDLRVVVVATGVQTAAQIRQLLPGSIGSTLVVTSTRRLGGLLDTDFVDVQLSPLDEEAGLRLLRSRLGESRVDAEPQAAARLVELCGGLPLALRIVAARLLAHRTRALADLAEELEDPSERLAGLSAGAELDVNSVFDAMIAALDEPAARALRVLSVHPGLAFSQSAAAALLDLPRPATRRLLDVLTDFCLLDEAGDGRLRFHELVWLRVREAAAARSDEAQHLARAADRIVDWYLAQAYRADWKILGNRLRVGGAPFDRAPDEWPQNVGTPRPDLPDAVAALDWIQVEMPNLLAAQELAVARGRDDVAWKFCEPLWPYLITRKPYGVWIDVHKVAFGAAERVGNTVGQAQAAKQWAYALRELGRVREAAERVGAARDLARLAGHARMIASTLEESGKLLIDTAQLEEATAAFEESLRINADLGNERGALLQQNMLGRILLDRGRADEAYDLLTEVHRAITKYDERNVARVRLNLAEASRASGRVHQAAELYGQAAAHYRKRGEPSAEIRALEGLAALARDRRTPDEAGFLARIVEIYQAGGAGDRARPHQERIGELTDSS